MHASNKVDLPLFDFVFAPPKGRIDIELPMKDPFNRSSITRNAFAVPVLRRLLGSAAELKSLHAM